MTPIEFPEHNTVFAKDQPEYLPLPAHLVDEPEGRAITCWKLTWPERIKVLLHGKFWFSQMTFKHPLQPQLPSVTSPFQ